MLQIIIHGYNKISPGMSQTTERCLELADIKFQFNIYNICVFFNYCSSETTEVVR